MIDYLAADHSEVFLLNYVFHNITCKATTESRDLFYL